MKHSPLELRKIRREMRLNRHGRSIEYVYYGSTSLAHVRRQLIIFQFNEEGD